MPTTDSSFLSLILASITAAKFDLSRKRYEDASTSTSKAANGSNTNTNNNDRVVASATTNDSISSGGSSAANLVTSTKTKSGKENDEAYPITQMLIEYREIAEQYARAKHENNRKHSFDTMTEILNQCIIRTQDGQEKNLSDDVQTYEP